MTEANNTAQAPEVPVFQKGSRVTFTTDGGEFLHGTVEATYPSHGNHSSWARVTSDDGRCWSSPQWRLDEEITT